MPASGTSEPQRCGGDQALGGREKLKKKILGWTPWRGWRAIHEAGHGVVWGHSL